MPSVHAEVDEHWVPIRNRGNDYLIDRVAQKTTSFTGIEGISEQDAAIQDSQGFIADRTREHLGPTDLGIVRFRRLVLDAAVRPAARRRAAGGRRAAGVPRPQRRRGGAGRVRWPRCSPTASATRPASSPSSSPAGVRADLHRGVPVLAARRALAGAVAAIPGSRSCPRVNSVRRAAGVRSPSRASIMASTLRAPAWKMAVALSAIQSKPRARICSARRTTRSWSW